MYYTQGYPHEAIIQFFSRNIGGQKRGEKYIQSDERKKTCQPRIFYPKNLFFKNINKIMTFSNKQNWGSLLLLGISYKKCKKGIFKIKWKNTK